MKRKPSEQLLVVAQEITFAKALASNDKLLRDRALRRLKKWFSSRSEASKSFTEDGFLRLWKGLYYNVWMSDKPLEQEELVEEISNLIHCFKDLSSSVLFIKCFLTTISDGWFGLDVHRIDKYLMFVRRFMRQCFALIANYDWKKELLLDLVQVFNTSFAKVPLGLFMHICEIYLEELAKITKGKLKEDVVLELIKPFGEIMSTSTDGRLIKHISDFIYLYLLQQSKLGIKHEIKFQTWKRMGYRGGNINLLHEIESNSEGEEDVENENDVINLDARAGHVDVLLPTLKFDGFKIVEHLTELKKRNTTTTKARKRIADLLNKYKTFEHGKYPLGIHKVDLLEQNDENEEIENAAWELLEEEREVYNEDKKHTRKKNKKLKTVKGEWEITQLKESDMNFVKNDNNFGKWKVTDIKNTILKSDESRNLSYFINLNKEENAKECSNEKKNTKRKNFQVQRNNEKSVNTDAEHSFTLDDWGGVGTWYEENKTDIVISPKKKCIFTTTNNYQESSNGKKKVEFVLNRNSIQDEEDYKRSLKRKPVIKINGNIEQPQSVLKSTTLSSPINPFNWTL